MSNLCKKCGRSNDNNARFCESCGADLGHVAPDSVEPSPPAPTGGSSKIALLPGEQVITSSSNDVLVLTSKRVRYDSIVWGRSSVVSITLGSVSSCGLTTKSFPSLLIISALILIAGFSQGSGLLTFVVASAFVLAYFLTRKAVISIGSNGGQSILAPTEGMNRDAALTFIEAVERQKLSAGGSP